MKKEIIVFLTVALMNALCFAKPSLIMGGSAKKFLKERNHLNFKKKNDKGMDDSVIATSFVVEINEDSHETIVDFRKLLNSSYSVSTYTTDKNAINYKNEKVKIDISDLESNRDLCAKKILNQVLPNKYRDQFKLVSVDEEWKISETKPSGISAYTFNFKRVFNGRIVRNRDNFLTVETDNNGRLKDVDVALQDLKTTTEILTISDDAEENETTLDSLLSSEPSDIKVVADDGLLKSKRMENVEVGSVAEAYCEVEDGSAKKLFPCLSYASTVNLEDGGKVSRIIDVPHSRGSWHHNRKGKKPVKLHRFNH